MKRLCLINTKRNGVKQRKVLLGLLLTNKNIWINYIQVLAETTAVFRCVVKRLTKSVVCIRINKPK